MAAEPDDAALAQRAREGDLDAYEALVRRHQHVAVRVARLLSGSTADAEDVTQDAFVKAYRGLGRYRDGAPFRPWLLAIVANEARNRRRAGRRRQHYELAASSHEPALDPERAALAAEDRRAVLAALDELPDHERLVIACRFLLDLTEAETAQVLRVPVGTVKSRAARGRARLRAALADVATSMSGGHDD